MALESFNLDYCANEWCAVIGREIGRTARLARQERKHLNSFPLPVRLGVQFLNQYIHTCTTYVLIQ